MAAPSRQQHIFSILTEPNYTMALWMPGFALHALWGQWHTIPLPSLDHFAGQTILVTGANVGLGREAACHFACLGAARVVVELGSFASVAAFCARAARELDRLDAVVENAGLATGDFALREGYESTITVNVLSTFLMALLLLPVLRRTAARYNVRPRLTIVSSDAHYFARFVEANEPSIFANFRDPAKMSHDRYNVSKLLEVFAVRELAKVLDANHVPVTLNTLNPGFCRTELFRGMPAFVRPFMKVSLFVMGRTAEMGARTLVAAAAAGPETHGTYMDAAEVWHTSAYVTSEKGADVQKRVFTELLDILEGVHPGIKKNLE
ncbi:short chain dehydrogenase reductase [Niveomyces insectorum RCEF 264]|uniref:Short chain dehydrogenase reductase n=1 Tax=Niveomyces insectorum RCEF 264 TaxID=1081102 RepID=A0A167X478_9HYPO|nr:short chain dehydrogenase reductase [Niveomyces insectorum RCEF 264]